MPWDIGEGRRVHTFAPVRAQAVAMVLHAPAKYGPGKSVLAELGAMAAAFGVDIAPTANEVLWHYGLLKGALPAQATDGTAANWACFLDPVTQKWATEGLVKLLAEMKQYPSFAGKIGYHDDVGMQSVSKDKDTLLCCYCPRCREAFRKQTGKDLPTAAEANWPTGVVPDDDPWVQFSLFRSRDCLGGLTRVLEEAKARVAPDVKMGTYTVKTFHPQAGYYGRGNFSRSSAVSSYTYPTFVVTGGQTDSRTKTLQERKDMRRSP